MKEIHAQFRHVYPSQSKSGDSCVSAFNHFLSRKDEVGAVYTDNSRELIAIGGAWLSSSNINRVCGQLQVFRGV